MAANGANVVARSVTDDLVVFSGESDPSMYTKFYAEQKLAECHRFVERQRVEVDASVEYIAELTAVVAEFQDTEDQESVHNALLAAKGMKMGEQARMAKVNVVIEAVLEEIEELETAVDILDGDEDAF